MLDAVAGLRAFKYIPTLLTRLLALCCGYSCSQAIYLCSKVRSVLCDRVAVVIFAFVLVLVSAVRMVVVVVVMMLASALPSADSGGDGGVILLWNRASVALLFPRCYLVPFKTRLNGDMEISGIGRAWKSGQNEATIRSQRRWPESITTRAFGVGPKICAAAIQQYYTAEDMCILGRIENLQQRHENHILQTKRSAEYHCPVIGTQLF